MSYRNLPSRRSVIACAVFAATASMGHNTFAQDGLVLEEIIVTAQKRESSIKDISATVNVVTTSLQACTFMLLQYYKLTVKQRYNVII